MTLEKSRNVLLNNTFLFIFPWKLIRKKYSRDFKNVSHHVKRSELVSDFGLQNCSGIKNSLEWDENRNLRELRQVYRNRSGFDGIVTSLFNRAFKHPRIEIFFIKSFEHFNHKSDSLVINPLASVDVLVNKSFSR